MQYTARDYTNFLNAETLTLIKLPVQHTEVHLKDSFWYSFPLGEGEKLDFLAIVEQDRIHMDSQVARKMFLDYGTK